MEGYVTGLDDGRIVKVSESGAIEELGNTGGRPLGIHGGRWQRADR